MMCAHTKRLLSRINVLEPCKKALSLVQAEGGEGPDGVREGLGSVDCFTHVEQALRALGQNPSEMSVSLLDQRCRR